MIKGKLVPIIVTSVLIVCIVVILIVNSINSAHYEKLIISYQNENIDHTSLEVNNVFVINNISFWVVSTTKNQIIINSSDKVSYNNKGITEIKLELNKDKEICFEDQTCALLELK